MDWIIPPLLADDLRQFQKFIEIIGEKNKPLMICGPSGVGKSLYLEIFEHHYNNKYPKSKVTRINVAAFNNNLIESELFGHAQGAFTGAKSNRDGFLKKADGGLLIIEEIGEIPKNIQAKLLTFIEDGYYYPVGSEQQERSNVAIVATTNKKKPNKKKNDLREDFWYRFTHHHVPPLYKRRTDIFYHLYFIFPELFNVIKKKDLFYLLTYSWPGNVREIENAVHSMRLEYKRFLRIRDGRAEGNDYANTPIFCNIPEIENNTDKFLNQKSDIEYFSYKDLAQYFKETFQIINPYGDDVAFENGLKLETEKFMISAKVSYLCYTKNDRTYETLDYDFSKYIQNFQIQKEDNPNIFEISEGDKPQLPYFRYADSTPIHPMESAIISFRRGDKQELKHFDKADIASLTEVQLLTHYYTKLAKETNHNIAEIARRSGHSKSAGQRIFAKYCRPDNGSRGSS